MEPVGIILLVLFLFIIVMGPMACVRMNARRNSAAAKVHNPQPHQMDTARRKLSTVTTSTILPRPNNVPATDIEASTPASEFGECPICIGPLVPEPTYAVTQDPRPVLEQVSMVTSHETTSQAKSQGTVGQTEGVTDTNDDILTINSCGHSFHSKCLSSWFLIDRYDCPVCRVPYYKGMPRHQQALNVAPFW